MKLKRITSIILSAAMLSAVCGCGGNGKNDTAKESAEGYPDTPYEINWYINAVNQPDVNMVEEEMNKILTKEINCTIKLNILDSAQYSKKLSTMMSAGEYFDLAYTSSSVLSYIDSVKSGAFFDMADYIDEYMPKTKALFDEKFLKTAYIDGKIGAIPTYKESGSQYGWIYRKDIADKYNIDMTQYKNLDDLEPVLKMIKEKEPDIEYPIEWDTSVLNQNLLSYDMPTPDCVIYFDNGVPRKEVKIFPDTDEFKNLAKSARRYFQEGLVKPDTLTATDASSRFEKGKAFVLYSPLKPGAAQEKFPNISYPIAQAGVTPIIQNSAQSAMIGVSATSKNPYRVMRFLELLYNNKELSNLLVHGIEGKHYNKAGENTVEIIENGGYDLSKSQWMLGNIFLNYLTTKDDPEKYEKFKEFNKEAIYNSAMAFTPDLSALELEKVAVNGVKTQYRNQALLGAVDPDTVIPEYVQKLKEAGIDKLIDSIQKQYDEFLKGDNK